MVWVMAVMNDQRPIYDRGLLLGGAKRNAVLEMWEVERYGTDSYGDADYVSVYGMRPADWYTKGVRLLGRTAVECTRDALADVIGKDVADVAALAPQKTRTLVVDPVNTDYLSGLTGISAAPDDLLIPFVAPPWGDAFDRTSGLDLRCTTPPIAEIVNVLLHRFSESRVLCAIQVHEIVDPGSMAEIRSRFDWSSLRVYELNAPGQNSGILLGAKGWAP